MGHACEPPSPGEVARVLSRSHGGTALYNLRNPLAELIFIVCSTLTQETNYRATYRALRQAFPTFDSLSTGTVDEIAAAIARGGLSQRKARGIRSILDHVVQAFGRPTLAPLARWSDDECEAFLTSLPLVGLKTARCVMLFSLDRQVFPVDTHCWRVSRRLGWVGPNPSDAPSSREMDELQSAIAPLLRGPLHVAMIGFGRATCRARRPRCWECELAPLCPSRG